MLRPRRGLRYSRTHFAKYLWNFVVIVFFIATNSKISAGFRKNSASYFYFTLIPLNFATGKIGRTICRANCFSHRLFDFYPHAPGTAFNYFHRAFYVVGGEVFHFLFGDFAHLSFTDFANLCCCVFPGTFLYAGRF